MISALIVNRNGEPWLERCLTSLGVPPPPDLEVILVDNASTDGSLDLARRKFPHVRLLTMGHNVGFAVANNLAAAVADGDCLLLLNNDAWLEDDALDRMVGRLASNPEIGLVAPRLLSVDGRPQFSWSPDRSLAGEAIQRVRNRFEGMAWNHGPVERVLRWVLGPGWYTAACVLVRRAAFEQVGGFDPAFFLYFEDADLCLRLRDKGWRLVWQPNAVAGHVGGPGTRNEAAQLHYRKSQLYYYSKHRPRSEEEKLWSYLVERYPEGAVARWLRHEETRRRPVDEAHASLAAAEIAGRLAKPTTRRLRRALDGIAPSGPSASSSHG